MCVRVQKEILLALVCGRTSNKKSTDNSKRVGWNSSIILILL